MAHYASTSFNPHPRVEGDNYQVAKDERDYVSIHTLAWRVTAGISLTCDEQMFQSTPSRGG